MAYTQEQLGEIAAFVTHITTLTKVLAAEGAIPSADRLVTPTNITKINDNIGDFSDYISTLVPLP